MHVYLLVNVLLLGITVALWCQGKLPHTTPAARLHVAWAAGLRWRLMVRTEVWLMTGNALAMAGAFSFILLSIWMAMCLGQIFEDAIEFTSFGFSFPASLLILSVLDVRHAAVSAQSFEARFANADGAFADPFLAGRGWWELPRVCCGIGCFLPTHGPLFVWGSHTFRAIQKHSWDFTGATDVQLQGRMHQLTDSGTFANRLELTSHLACKTMLWNNGVAGNRSVQNLCFRIWTFGGQTDVQPLGWLYRHLSFQRSILLMHVRVFKFINHHALLNSTHIIYTNNAWITRVWQDPVLSKKLGVLKGIFWNAPFPWDPSDLPRFVAPPSLRVHRIWKNHKIWNDMNIKSFESSITHWPSLDSEEFPSSWASKKTWYHQKTLEGMEMRHPALAPGYTTFCCILDDVVSCRFLLKVDLALEGFSPLLPTFDAFWCVGLLALPTEGASLQSLTWIPGDWRALAPTCPSWARKWAMVTWQCFNFSWGKGLSCFELWTEKWFARKLPRCWRFWRACSC